MTDPLAEFRLDGEVAVVTGGSSGLGKVVAEAFAAVGARVANFDLAATSVKHLFELLAERHPALAPHLAEGVAVAIDGQIYQDTLHEPIAPDSEVFVLPQIAGG